MADDKRISELPLATTPLAGTEEQEIVQGGVNKRVAVSEVGGGGGAWGSITGTLANQTDLNTALGLKAPLASPALTGTPTVPTAAAGTKTTQAASTEFININNRYNETITGNTTVDQTDDQKVLFANSATSIVITLPVLEANTYLTVVQVNDGDISWANDGTTFVGASSSIPGGIYGNSVTFWYRSTTEVLVIAGNIASTGSLAIGGTLSLRAGNSVGTIAKGGGVIHTNVTAAGNVGTGEDTIFTYALPANTLFIDKDSITGYVTGTFAANANNKQVKLKFGATTIIATGAVAFNTGDWRIDFNIIRTGAATQKCSCRFTCSNALLPTHTDYTTAGETLTGAINVVVTGEATSNNDIVGEMYKIKWEPHE